MRPTAAVAHAARSFWRRPGVVLSLRIVCVLVGLAGSLMALFFASLATLFSDCSGGVLSLCTEFTGAALVVEWVVVVVAVAAPITGGIASYLSARWRWLPAGLVVATAASSLTLVLADSGGY